MSFLYWYICLFIVCCFTQATDDASLYGWPKRTSQDYQLRPKPKQFDDFGFLSCLVKTVVLTYWRWLRQMTKTNRSPPSYIEPKEPEYHQQHINQLINQLVTQRYEARELHRAWIRSSRRIPFELKRMLDHHLSEWQQLLIDWNITLHHCDYRPVQCQWLLHYQWQLTNQTITFLYPQQMTQIRSIQYNYQKTHRAQLSVLVDHLNQVHQHVLYETDRWIERQLRHVQRDVYLQVYNAMYHHHLIEPDKIRLADMHPLDIWWIEEIEATLPWYAGRHSLWEWIVALWDYLMDYLLFCLDRFNKIQTETMLL